MTQKYSGEIEFSSNGTLYFTHIINAGKDINLFVSVNHNQSMSKVSSSVTFEQVDVYILINIYFKGTIWYKTDFVKMMLTFLHIYNSIQLNLNTLLN